MSGKPSDKRRSSSLRAKKVRNEGALARGGHSVESEVQTRRSAVKQPAPQDAVVPDPRPTQEQIRARAYEKFLRRCMLHQAGDALSDWYAAERELFDEAGQVPSGRKAPATKSR